MSSVAHAQHTRPCQRQTTAESNWMRHRTHKPNAKTKFVNFQRQFCYLLTHELLGSPHNFPTTSAGKNWISVPVVSDVWSKLPMTFKKTFFISCGPQLVFSGRRRKNGEKNRSSMNKVSVQSLEYVKSLIVCFCAACLFRTTTSKHHVMGFNRPV